MSRSGPSLVRRNVLANAAGGAWAALMALAFVPVYLHFLGVEGYGIIGVFLAVTAIVSLLDLGLGTTLNRQLATMSVQPGPGQRMRDLVRTLEVLYWAVGMAAGLALAALAPLIASNWLQPEQMTRQTIERAFQLMGLAIACQWPVTLYNGGLAGLQHQVLLNAVSIAATTVRNVGAALVLWHISPTVEAFLAWNVAVNLVQSLATAAALWRVLPPGTGAARFKFALLRELWRFAAGMTGISALGVVLTQLDKLILSKVLSLEAFGYYSLAWRVASGLYYLVGPVAAAFFPRLSQLVASESRDALAALYHRGCQLLSVFVLPVAVVLAFYPAEVLLLWTLDNTVAQTSATMLRLLAIGTAINGLMNLPLTLQLAHGWTRLVLVSNIVAVTALAPMIYLASLRHGGVGAAWIWIVLNAGYALIMVPLMHRRVLPGQFRAWLLEDVGMPLAASLSVATAWNYAIGLGGSYGEMLLGLAAVFLLSAMAAALAAPQIRALIIRQLLRPPHPVARP